MTFTADNTTDRTPNWLIWLNEFIGKPTKALEIGAYEGRSSIWFVDNILTHPESGLLCVDPWEITSEPYASRGTNLDAVYNRFKENISQHTKINHWRVPSYNIEFNTEPNQYFDFIYVDGSHWPEDVLNDALMAFRLVRCGGIIIFDDYEWKYNGPQSEPKIAIDAFLSVYQGRYVEIAKGYQVAIRKI